MTEEGELPAPRKDRTLLLLFLGSFVFLVVLSAIVLVARPSLRKELYEKLKYGTVSKGGLLLFLEPGEGRRLRLSLINTGETKTMVAESEANRDQLSVHVRDELGAAVPYRDDMSSAWPVWAHDLEPGGKYEMADVDLDKFVELPGPGRYHVVVEASFIAYWRAQEPGRLRSNELVVDLR